MNKLALFLMLLLPSANAQEEPMMSVPRALLQAMVDRNEELRGLMQSATDEIERLQKALSTEKAGSGCV